MTVKRFFIFLTFISSELSELIVYLSQENNKTMDSENKLEERKKYLVEKYGAFMERHEHMTPISARIFATLFIGVEDGEGETFDGLVSFLGASKSTISTNLQLLSKAGYITYFTKPGERKKYFILSPESFLARVEDEMLLYKKEHEIVSEIVDYRCDVKGVAKNEGDSFPYLDFLSASMKLLDDLIIMIRTKCENRKNRL